MENLELDSLQTKRVDPTTGIVYTFTMSSFTPNRDVLIQPGIPPKEFVLSVLWWLANLSPELADYPNVKNEARELLPLVDWVISSVTFDIKLIQSEGKESFDYNYGANYDRAPKKSPTPGIAQPPSADLMRSISEEILNSDALMLTMVEYLRINKAELENRAREELNINEPDHISVPLEGDTVEGEKTESESKTNRLFPNSKDLAKNQWAMPHWLSTQVNRGVKEANKTSAEEQYINSGDRDRVRKSVFKIKNSDKTETEFIFDKQKLAIETAEQFADKLMKLKDAKVLQTFFALMKWMNLKDTSVFRNVPISDIMELVLKPNGENKFNTAQRREFSEVLEYLANVSITVSVIGSRVNPKTGKSKPVLREENGVRLFRFMAEYSVRKEFQSIPKESLLKDIHFDKSVINRFSGEILPGNAHLFGSRGNVYFDSLLELDANKDAKAIIMGFTFQTRFNQITDKEKCIEVDRPYLVDLCDYEKTNATKPSQATKQLANNLDKLVGAGIIAKYSGLTNKDEDRIKVYPPQQKKAKEIVE